MTTYPLLYTAIQEFMFEKQAAGRTASTMREYKINLERLALNWDQKDSFEIFSLF